MQWFSIFCLGIYPIVNQNDSNNDNNEDNKDAKEDWNDEGNISDDVGTDSEASARKLVCLLVLTVTSTLIFTPPQFFASVFSGVAYRYLAEGESAPPL